MNAVTKEAGMNTYQIITGTIRSLQASPTVVLNTLIDLENRGGISAVHELEYRLGRLVETSTVCGLGALSIVRAWHDAARAYISSYCPETFEVAA